MKEQELDELVDEVCRNRVSDGRKESALIPILQNIQSELGYLPRRAMKRISNNLRVPPSQVYGVATFYHQFRLRPEGKHIITQCRGTACHVSGATEIYNYLMRHLGITPPEDTSPDGLFTIKEVRCIGACSLAPIIKIDDEVYGRLDTSKLRRILAKYSREAEQ